MYASFLVIKWIEPSYLFLAIFPAKEKKIKRVNKRMYWFLTMF
jgi:hypothetical protein